MPGIVVVALLSYTTPRDTIESAGLSSRLMSDLAPKATLDANG
ncbi:MAG: hypothetical protein K0Q89_3010, partial [Thermomicrobiales bacterium]|nr:hypothetical protein [Thermomicrobiales bacterium]